MSKEDKESKDLSESQLRIVDINNRLDDIQDLYTTILSGVQSLKWYHVCYIGFFFSLGLGWIAFNWVLNPENRSVLLNVAGKSRLVGFVDNCGVVKVPFNDNSVHVVFINYQNKEGKSRHLAAVVDGYDTNQIKPVCASLYRDRMKIQE